MSVSLQCYVYEHLTICMCYRPFVCVIEYLYVLQCESNDAEICCVTDINCGFGRISRNCGHNSQAVSY